MKRKTLLLLLIMALGATGAWAQTRYSGSGTSSDPYLIQSVSDWNTFADAVTGGTSYTGTYFKLTTDITVSKTAGNPTNIWTQTLSTSFRGTFDGDGHTITLDNIEYTAEFGGLFRMLGVGGTVKNLKVNGSVSSSSNNVGGIVGVTSAYSGQCLIENCWSDVTITSSGTYNAGIVAYTNNTTYIKGCIFTGKLLGTTGSVGGGICAHTVNTANTSIQDCIFAPSQITMNTASSKTFCATDNLTTNCYYYTDATFGTTQGTQAYKVTLAANPAAGGTVDGGEPTTNYGFIKAYSNGLLCNGIYYANGSVNLRATANEGYTFSQWNDGNNSSTRSITVNADASYTATFTQGGGGDSGGDSFTVLEDFETGNFNKMGWTFGGNANWTIVNSDQYAGSYCAKSGTITHSQNTDLIFTGNFADGTISFYRKVSSESGYDKLHFYIDGSEQSGSPWSGTVAWSEVSYAVTAGTHTLKWSYTKDSSVSSGSDCAWVDNISLPLVPPTNIATKADWNLFCAAVNSGHNYSGEEVTLANDISGVTTMCGTSSNPFRGTFDGTDGNGQQHKITLNLTASEDICAPFRYINGATIQNLKVDGTVNGNGYKQLSGLVGIAAGGSSTIYNCSVSATLTTNFSGDSSHGGLVMQQSNGATLTIEGCAFTGTFNFGSSHKFAGFVGWREGNYPSLTIKNCMFAPASLTYDSSTTEDNNQSQNFMRNGGNSTSNFTLTNSYYTTAVRTSTQGKQAYSVTGGTDIAVAAYGSATSNYGASGISVYGTTGMVHNGTLYAGNGDNVQLNITYSGSLSGYTLEATNGALSGTANPYTLAKGTGETVINAEPLKYHIANTVSATQMTWDQFAALVNSGVSYSGETVYLDENITTAVTVSVGTGSDGSTPFSGTFDGKGHTLNVNIPSSGSAGNAPFKHIIGATIKNLVVEGTVNETNRHAAGLVGYSWSGTNTIENCWVKTNVTSTNDYAGGIIGHGKTSNIVMRGCVYSGTITATGTNPVGGLVGWSDNLTGLTIEDCFFNGNYSNSNSSRKFHPIGCTGHGDEISTSVRTITNTYYTLDHSDLNATTQTLVYNLSDKGKFAYTITAQSPAAVDNAGNATTYGGDNVTHYITGYGTGIKYNNVLYAGDGDEVSLTLNGSSISYDADYGTLTQSGSNWTLAMEAHNTQISASNCYAPTNLTVSGINANGATLTWEGGDPSYIVESGVEVTTTEIQELLNENFEGISGTAYNSTGSMPDNWFSHTTSTGNNIVAPHVTSGSSYNYYHSSSQSVNLEAGTNANNTAYVVLPLCNNVTEMTYYARRESTSYGTLQLGYVDAQTAAACSEFHVLNDNITPTTTVTQYTLDFVNTYTLPANKYIAFKWETTGSYYACCIDDVVVKGNVEVTTTVWTPITDNATSPYTFNGETGTEYLVRVSSTCGQVSNEVTFKPQKQTYIFTNNYIDASQHGDGQWSTPTNWNPVGLPTTDDNVEIRADVTIPSGCLAQADTISFYSNPTTGEVYGSITIEDGGQLWHSNTGVNLTIERDIPGYLEDYEDTNLGYKIISFPVGNLTPHSTDVTGLLTSSHYDFYTFDYTNQVDRYLEWVCVIGAYDSDQMDPHNGYLYANQDSTTISVTGVVAPSAANDSTPFIVVSGDEPFNGWYMVGNPFVCNAYLTANGDNLDFYQIQDNDDYAEFVINIDNTVAIPPMGGVMVRVHDDDYLVYSRTAPTNSKGGILNVDVNKVLSSKDGSAAETIDRARLRFGEGRNLEKLQLNPRHTKLYIPEGAKDYSVVYTEGAGSMPVNFKAENNGHYTLSFSTEDVNFNYLHLIDNMTGTDVDLLAGASTPSTGSGTEGSATYTFNTKTTDYESRFKLVFAASDVDGSSTGSETFAFYSNGVWVVNNEGDATLQVVDINGRILSSERISGATTKAINAASGIYMLRLINGDNVKVQKIVVR